MGSGSSLANASLVQLDPPARHCMTHALEVIARMVVAVLFHRTQLFAHARVATLAHSATKHSLPAFPRHVPIMAFVLQMAQRIRSLALAQEGSQDRCVKQILTNALHLLAVMVARARPLKLLVASSATVSMVTLELPVLRPLTPVRAHLAPTVVLARSRNRYRICAPV